jgi:uncharacterized protein YdhG (YjbR/CyaY superfamily)
MTLKSIDDYHSEQPEGIQKKLEQLRKAINHAAPKATETISYGMPAFKQNKMLVYYAAYKSHIGFYPTPNAIVAFKAELTKYKTSKGAIQFPNNEPLPIALIKKIVKFRLQEDEQVVPSNSIKTKKTQSPIVQPEIEQYNKGLEDADRAICDTLASAISKGLTNSESKVWHGHPVWFLDGNPIAGYSKQKPGIRLMFWSGADFEEPGLNVIGQKFKDASVFYNKVEAINTPDLKRWLKKSIEIQWDYKNIVKRKGKLVRL